MKIIQKQYSTHSFFNIAPGLGKTKLILAAAINLVQTTEFPVYVLNSDKTLCDRDFQEATFSLEELKIPFASVLSQQAKIIFSTTQDFIDFKDNLPEKYHTLLDEYQNIFFKEEKFFEFVQILKLSESFIGFSGSPLNSAQKKLLENSFNKQTLVLQLTPTTDLGDQETVVCKTQALLIKELSQIADKFRLDTPQVFILDPQTAAALIKGRKKQPYVSLIDQEAPIVNNILSELFNKPSDDGSYGTYIINEEMGTGTNFKTSADIESKGGLVLVFGIKPTNTSTFEQLSCRVGRIFNKSRRFYVIHDAAYVGPSQQYLKYQLKILKQKESEDARALFSKLKLNDEDQYVKSDSVSECNEDFDMQDETMNQLSHTQNYSDESFGIERSEIESKKNQRKQSKDAKNEKQVKKRLQKELDKIVSRETKLFQHKKEEEECKICGDAYIEPHFSQKDQINVQPSQVGSTKLCSGEMALDPNIFLKGNDHFGLDQTSTDQSGMLDRKGSEVAFQHNYLLENVEESLPKFDNQLQKRNKDIKKTQLLEQQVRKSLQDQEQQVKAGAGKQKTQKDLVDIHFAGQSKSSTRLQAKQVINYDDLYFRTYEADEIHEEMLNDEVRMNVYQQSINETCKDQVVIDVGAGTGILSIFAAEAGASHVYGIEYTNMIEKAKDKVSQSDLAAQITLVKGKAEDVDLGQIKVDVIVSEWMGYFLLFENMLPSVLSIRDRYLKEEGTMLPKRTSIYFAGINKKCKDAEKFIHTAMIEECEQQFLVSTSHQIFSFDLEIDKIYDQKGFASTFELVMLKDCLMTGFVAWFDAAMTDNVMLSTSPEHPLTHWKQTLFYLPEGIEVQRDTKIAGKVIVGHQKENSRALWFTISYKTQTMKKSRSVCYSMD